MSLFPGGLQAFLVNETALALLLQDSDRAKEHWILALSASCNSLNHQAHDLQQLIVPSSLKHLLINKS
jgi:hypothetical protein